MYGLNWEGDDVGATAKFRVGDRVKVVVNDWGTTFPKGEAGTVQEVLGHGVTVSRDGHDDYGWFFGFDGVAPAPAEQVQGGTASGRYRVGDRVRVVKCGYEEGGSYHRMSVGDADTIIAEAAADFLGRVEGERYFYYPHEITPAFRPGDRVKLNKHHGLRTYGDRGTVTSALGDSVAVRMDEPSMYGSVVAVFPDSVLDWEREEEEHAADCAGRKEQQGKPKFKAGDVVVYKDGTGGPYTIKCVKTHYDLISKDPVGFNEIAYDYVDGGWDFERTLELAAPCPQDNEQPRNVETLTLKLELDTSDFTDKLDAALGINRPCIVALVKNGQPRPSTYPHVHASVASATQEAERLARINPGQEFAVYQRVTARVAEVQMKEVA